MISLITNAGLGLDVCYHNRFELRIVAFHKGILEVEERASRTPQRRVSDVMISSILLQQERLKQGMDAEKFK